MYPFIPPPPSPFPSSVYSYPGGEALTVADPNEGWVFHVIPDDTGSSAVWVAQRVPNGKFSTVCNIQCIECGVSIPVLCALCRA